MITERDVYKVIKELIEFPFPQVCVHHAAGKLITMLENCGYEIDNDLVHSIVFAEDEKSLAMLEDKIK
jgi:hypothetical protein